MAPRPKRRRASGLLAVLACGLASEPTAEPAAPPATAVASAAHEGDRLGQPAPDFAVDGWIVDGRLAAGPSLAALKGRVVLVRFWTDTCPYCRATAPALVELDRDFRDRGLVVLGLYHPKPRPDRDAPLDLEAEARRIAPIAERMGFRFPIGLDWHWRTLDAWWLDPSDGEARRGDRHATSATLVVDAHGVIRGVHPGPEYHPDGPADHAQCRADYAGLRATVLALLAERELATPRD